MRSPSLPARSLNALLPFAPELPPPGLLLRFLPALLTIVLPAVQIALKCSDLGHLTSSVEVHKQWVARLEEVSASRRAIQSSGHQAFLPECALPPLI